MKILALFVAAMVLWPCISMLASFPQFYDALEYVKTETLNQR